MIVKKIKIQNYKLFKDQTIELNEGINIFVGENDAGKSSVLEAISIIQTGKINGVYIEKLITSSMFNNECRKEYLESLNGGSAIIPPSITIEAYCKNDVKYENYRGTNNSLNEDEIGVIFSCEFDSKYSSLYKEQLKKNLINDIPLEFYSMSFKTFNGDNNIPIRFLPFNTIIIDTSKKDYGSLINKFIYDNMTEYITDEEQINIKTEYRKNQQNFKDNLVIKNLNDNLKTHTLIYGKNVSIEMKENNLEKWKENMDLLVEDIPFDNIGYGTQNSIKIELALSNNKDVGSIIIEEPENNLSYGNMNKLISRISKDKTKQIFISSHSSFVINKLGLNNIFIIKNGVIDNLKSLDSETKNYFEKLPGFDTLRVVLANKILLVEGPADDLIIQKAYLDKYEKLPIESGLDIISVSGLSFKRYLDICNLIDKKVAIVTDNDGNIKESIIEKYKDYLTKPNITFFYERDESLNTLEPSVLSANCCDDEDFIKFKKVISKNDSLIGNNKSEIKDFMTKNKTEWSLRVFNSDKKIKYPKYITDAISEE